MSSTPIKTLKGNKRSIKVYEYLDLAKDTIFNYDTHVKDCNIDFTKITQNLDSFNCKSAEKYKILVKKIFNKVQYFDKEYIKQAYNQNIKQFKNIIDTNLDADGTSKYLPILFIHNEMLKSNFWFNMYSILELKKLGFVFNLVYSDFKDFKDSGDYEKIITDSQLKSKKLIFFFTDDISYSGEQIVRFIKRNLIYFIGEGYIPHRLNNINIEIFFNLINITYRAFTYLNKEISLTGYGKNNSVKNIFPNRLTLADGSIDSTKYVKNFREILMEIYNEDITKDTTIFPPRQATNITSTNLATIKDEDDILLKYIFYNDLFFINNSLTFFPPERLEINSFFYRYFVNATSYNELNNLTSVPSSTHFLVTLSYLPFKYADHLSNFQRYCFVKLGDELLIDINKFFNINKNEDIISLYDIFKPRFSISYDLDMTNTTDQYIYKLIERYFTGTNRAHRLQQLKYLDLGFDNCELKYFKTLLDGKKNDLIDNFDQCEPEINQNVDPYVPNPQFLCPKAFYKTLNYNIGRFTFGGSFMDVIDVLP